LSSQDWFKDKDIEEIPTPENVPQEWDLIFDHGFQPMFYFVNICPGDARFINSPILNFHPWRQIFSSRIVGPARLIYGFPPQIRGHTFIYTIRQFSGNFEKL
jgi:hypothetical protein